MPRLDVALSCKPGAQIAYEEPELASNVHGAGALPANRQPYNVLTGTWKYSESSSMLSSGSRPLSVVWWSPCPVGGHAFPMESVTLGVNRQPIRGSGFQRHSGQGFWTLDGHGSNPPEAGSHDLLSEFACRRPGFVSLQFTEQPELVLDDRRDSRCWVVSPCVCNVARNLCKLIWLGWAAR